MTDYSRRNAGPPGSLPLGDPYPTGPSPLSPFWPQPEPPEPHATEWAALAEAFTALRRAAIASLLPEPDRPFFLSLAEHAQVEAGIAKLKLANAEILPHNMQVRELASWPTPVLPSALFGARDLAAILSVAIRCALSVHERVLFERLRQPIPRAGAAP